MDNWQNIYFTAEGLTAEDPSAKEKTLEIVVHDPIY